MVQPGHLLPKAVRVALPGRGTTRVWDSGNRPGTADSPAILLLHGWNIDAPANFGSVFNHLATSHRVVMYDHHGHGGGVRPDTTFTLEDAANDSAAVLDALEVRETIAVGYSMGGAIAQLFARDSPDRCSGLVLMATADRFSERRREQAQFASFGAAARALRRVPEGQRSRVFDRIAAKACEPYPEWILETVLQADPATLLEAGAALGRFDSSPWAHQLRVPSAFVMTTQDVIVPPARQLRLACQLDVDLLHTVAAGHDLPIRNDRRFVEAIEASIHAVRRGRATDRDWSPAATHLAH